jgi:hypothetical protein
MTWMIVFFSFLLAYAHATSSLTTKNATYIEKRQQFNGNNLPYIQLIAIGLVAPIHIVQSPRSGGKILFLERINGGELGTTHASEFDPLTGESRPVTFGTDVFCSTGFISPDPLARVFNVGGWDGPAVSFFFILKLINCPYHASKN